jgi:hypothetical protein
MVVSRWVLLGPRRRIHGLVLAFLAAMATQAGAQGREDQVVLDWNVTTLQVAPPPTHTRALAMVHTAMFDAVNAVDRRYTSYQDIPRVTTLVNATAAAAGAAYGVLVRLQPSQKTVLDAALATSLASIPSGPEKDAGLALGDQVAAGMVALRAGDNFLLPNPTYTPGTGPAEYQLTPPAFANPVNQTAHLWVPFVMASSDEFRPNGPPRLSSRRFVEDYDETRTMGVACPFPDNCERTAEQTLIAQWHTEQAQLQLSRVARILTLTVPANLLETARTFALLGMALADAGVSVFEAKYVYRYVRPVTAIRAGDADGVDETVGDPEWTPLLPTPPHPEYPSAHAVIQSAGGEVIKRAFGRDTSFDTTSAAVPGVTRHFENFDAFVADGQVARIYGGMHFRTAVEEGVKQGRKVGKRVLDTALLPLD